MERVQYSLERTLPVLRLLDSEGILSKEELQAVTSQRRDFEARLIRRKAEKQDFLHYIAFEQDVNRLILLRARARQECEAAEAEKYGASDSTQLLPRHFFAKIAANFSAVCISIFERMARKFPWDIDCWEQYLNFVKRQKMRVIVGRVYARCVSVDVRH